MAWPSSVARYSIDKRALSKSRSGAIIEANIREVRKWRSTTFPASTAYNPHRAGIRSRRG